MGVIADFINIDDALDKIKIYILIEVLIAIYFSVDTVTH